MRILLVTHLYPPHHQAGVEQYTQGLASALTGPDDVFVATTRKILSRPSGHLHRVRSRDGVTVCEFVANHDFQNRSETYLNPAMERGFLRFIEQRCIEVVHFQHLMYWSTGLVEKLRSKGIPVFLTLHDYWLMCGRMGQLRRASGELCDRAEPHACSICLAAYPFGQSPLAIKGIVMLTAIRNRCGIPLDGVLRGMRRMSGWFTRRAQKTQVDSDVRPLPRSEFDNRRAAFLDAACNANAVLVPTDTFRTSFIEWGIPESLLQHVSQGRDHAPFDRLNPVPRGSGSLRVGFIGQIAAHKGVRELIAAVQQIEEDRIDLRIIGPVVGDRSYLAECKSDSADNANVHFVGSIGSNEIPGVYETLDVLVVPSLWNECSPLTIQEAFMSGVPVVASDIGGMREMIEHDVSGLLFPMGDVDALASALRQLCDDEDLRQRLADGVPDVCSLADHAAELRGLYAEALGGS